MSGSLLKSGILAGYPARIAAGARVDSEPNDPSVVQPELPGEGERIAFFEGGDYGGVLVGLFSHMHVAGGFNGAGDALGRNGVNGLTGGVHG